MLPAEAIREAAKLIEAGWSQGAAARDGNGREVPLHVGAERAGITPEAVAFSVYGALATIMRRERVVRTALVFDVLYRLAAGANDQAPGGTNYVHPVLAFNDATERTKDEVLALLADAAEQCEQIGDGTFPSPIPIPVPAAEAVRP